MGAATPNRNGEDEAPVGRSMVRRKSKGTSETTSSSMKKKKKVAQRGMGVEKLERQRIQEEWNKINLHSSPPPPPPPSVDHHYSLQGFNSYIHFNAFFNSLDCNSQRCNACHKKKKVTNHRNLGSEICKFAGECGFVGTNQRNETVQVQGGGGGRVMEYEFFPLTSSSSSSSSYVIKDEDEQTKKKKKNTMITSSYIDLSLSLKLAN